MNSIFSWSLVAVLTLTASPNLFSQTITGPGIIPIGSPLTFGGTNAPDTYSANTTFSSTPVVVDNGAVKIWQVQTPTASNAEWDIFYMETTDGGPLANNISGYWNILMNYTVSAPANFDGVVNQFLVNGTPVGPLTNFLSICCASATNPILPGWSYYNSGFSSPIPAGVFSNWQEIYTTSYSLFSEGGVNPDTANEFVFALHFTLQPAAPTITKVISASAFGAFPTFAPGSWIEIYGSNLGASTQTWTSSEFNGINAPTTLGGTTVTIAGQPAFVDYISPTQVNVQVPQGVGLGPEQLTLTTAVGSTAPFAVTVNADQPGLLAPASFDLSGTQYAVALFSDGATYVLPPGAISGITSKRAVPGDTITLYGVGFGSVTPTILPGEIAQGTSTLGAPVTVSFGGTPAQVTYDGLAPNYVGLYQINVTVPNIAASDTVPVTFTLNGVPGTQTLYLAIGN